MNRVFISYRHAKPDEDLARAIRDGLVKEGIEVFVDDQIPVGEDWAQEIDRQVAQAEFFVVLLSADSIGSDMIRQEIRLAYERKRKGGFRILPVRVSFTESLPYDLGAYVGGLQYASWDLEVPFSSITEQLLHAIRDGTPLPELASQLIQSSALSISARGAPLPKSDLRYTMDTDAISGDSPFYLVRDVDRRIEERLEGRGETFVVRGPRQVGKSSLLARTIGVARRSGVRSVRIDFQEIDASSLENLGKLLRNVATRICRELNPRVAPNDVWDDDLGDKGSLAELLEKVVLPVADRPVIVCLDEVDRVFRQPYRDDFFAMIRAWHNKRATEAIWDRLHLLIVHSTDPTRWIQDLDESPFNVGQRMSLADFGRDHLVELNARYGSPLKRDQDIEQLHELVAGQPYLSRQALYYLQKKTWTMASLSAAATRPDGPFGDHLRGRLTILERNLDLKKAFKTVLVSGACPAEIDFQRLRDAGFIAGDVRTEVRPRCALYRQYFQEHLS